MPRRNFELKARQDFQPSLNFWKEGPPKFCERMWAKKSLASKPQRKIWLTEVTNMGLATTFRHSLKAKATTPWCLLDCETIFNTNTCWKHCHWILHGWPRCFWLKACFMFLGRSLRQHMTRPCFGTKTPHMTVYSLQWNYWTSKCPKRGMISRIQGQGLGSAIFI
jgi:hypothetical protein